MPLLLICCFVLLGGVLGACTVHPAEEATGTTPSLVYEMTNGYWYRDGRFEEQTMYAVDGVLRANRPENVREVIDLAGGYVLPAFGDAHTHWPAVPERVSEHSLNFLPQGVFYLMNQGSPGRYRQAVRALVNGPESVDVAFAFGLVGSKQSHGMAVFQKLAKRSVYPGMTVEDLDGDGYFIVESAADIDAHWPTLMAAQPDFVKIMVEHSDDHHRRRDDPEFFGRSGLDPALVPPIIARAHSEGLRVSAHIETAVDFALVVDAGIDMVAHMPGYDLPSEDDLTRYRITPEDAAKAARQGVAVVTTTLLSQGFGRDDPERLSAMRKNHAANLHTLANAGVELIIGSDRYGDSAVDEVMNLASLGVLDRAMLVSMLCSKTPQAIFPDRRIGTLEDGAEASLVVLGGNPLEDLSHLREPTRVFKDGQPLEFPEDAT